MHEIHSLQPCFLQWLHEILLWSPDQRRANVQFDLSYGQVYQSSTTYTSSKFGFGQKFPIVWASFAFYDFGIHGRCGFMSKKSLSVSNHNWSGSQYGTMSKLHLCILHLLQSQFSWCCSLQVLELLINLHFWLEENCNSDIFQDTIAWTTNLTQRIYEFRPEKEGFAWKAIRKTAARNHEWQFDVWNVSYGKYQTLSKMSSTYPKVWRMQQNDL